METARRRLGVLSSHVLGVDGEAEIKASASVQTMTTSSESVMKTMNPFHLAFPVHDLDLARQFWGTVMGCEEGRSSARWIDYNFYGHQIVCHLVGSEYRAIDYFNPVDKDDVPVHHFGVVLSVEQFHELKDRLIKHNVKFQIPPTLRFKGQRGEQYTMFFRDPSGNALEFKAMTNPDNLFAKYVVEEK